MSPPDRLFLHLDALRLCVPAIAEGGVCLASIWPTRRVGAVPLRAAKESCGPLVLSSNTSGLSLRLLPRLDPPGRQQAPNHLSIDLGPGRRAVTHNKLFLDAEGRRAPWELESAVSNAVAETFFGGWRDAALDVRSRSPCIAKTTSRMLKQTARMSAATASLAVPCPCRRKIE